MTAGNIPEEIGTVARAFQAIDPRYFHLILFPTEKCSFRCSYCYEDFSVGKMSSSTIAGIKKLLSSRSADIEELEVSWFGGEPLLAKDVVFEVHEHIKSLPPTFKFSANMTTNGFHLDIETARVLISAGVRAYQISLDGQEAEHNKTRIGKGGFPTFNQIMSNLADMREIDEDFQVILRLHYHPGNIESIKSLAQDLVQKFSCDGRYKIYFKNINHLGGVGDKTFVVYDYRKQAEVKQQLELVVTEGNMLYSGGDKNYICYASRLNSFAIRADGRVAKCTVALSDDLNTVGSITSEGKLLLDNGKLKVWARGLESADPLALQCPLHSPR